MRPAGERAKAPGGIAGGAKSSEVGGRGPSASDGPVVQRRAGIGSRGAQGRLRDYGQSTDQLYMLTWHSWLWVPKVNVTVARLSAAPPMIEPSMVPCGVIVSK
jgi:hypothetical protein